MIKYKIGINDMTEVMNTENEDILGFKSRLNSKQ